MNRRNLSARLGGTAADQIVNAVFPLVPTRRSAAVAGTPDDEGNAVEVLRWLLDYTTMSVTWLRNEPESNLNYLLQGCRRTPRIVRKNSLEGFALAAVSRYVFTTHGVYGLTRRSGNRVVINVWHGDGPKRIDNAKFRGRVASDFVVAGCQLWGAYKASYFDVPGERLLVVGNPRIDQFSRPATPTQLRLLGIEPERPFVLWAPTYRASRQRRGTELIEGAKAGAGSWTAGVIEGALGLAGDGAPQLVVKPHPLDVDAYGIPGVVVLDGEALRAAGTTLYSVLASAAGLLTDYSSIWVDYLVLDRPIGFLAHDMEDYESNRGFISPNLMDLLPGPMLSDPRALAEFLEQAVTQEHVTASERRATAAAELGLIDRLGATARLMESLGASRGGL